MNSSDPAQQKDLIRASARELRQQLEPRQREELDRNIGEHLLNEARKRPSSSLGAFLSFDGEPDLGTALLALRAERWLIALPVLGEAGSHAIRMHEWRQDTPLEANRYGILEPLDGEPLSLDRIDILCIPLVAYDAAGTRLGMGGGFYDRLLMAYKNSDHPLRVGVGYSLQQVSKLPREHWDVPLHAILNEEGWFPLPL